jgi:hypothetical protein
MEPKIVPMTTTLFGGLSGSTPFPPCPVGISDLSTSPSENYGSFSPETISHKVRAQNETSAPAASIVEKS